MYAKILYKILFPFPYLFGYLLTGWLNIAVSRSATAAVSVTYLVEMLFIFQIYYVRAKES